MVAKEKVQKVVYIETLIYQCRIERPTKTKDQGILEIEIKDFLSRNFGQGIQGNQGILFI